MVQLHLISCGWTSQSIPVACPEKTRPVKGLLELDLFERAPSSFDDLIEMMACATIETIVLVNTHQVASLAQQGGKNDCDIALHDSPPCCVSQLRVEWAGCVA
jgi:hypothetical protein